MRSRFRFERPAVLLAALLGACGPREGGSPGSADEPAPGATGATGATGVDLAERIAALEALGYAGGDRPATEEAGVLVHDAAHAWPGLNLYGSEHAPRVFLMDMEGVPLHEWPVRLHGGRRDVFPRRVRLLAGGELLVLVEKQALLRIDRDGRVLWQVLEKLHHDFDVDADGNVLALGLEARVFPDHGSEPILDDYVAVISPDGRVLRRVSLLGMFERSACCRGLLPVALAGDVFHSNTLEILGPRSPAQPAEFRAGRLLTSWRELDAIGLVDLEAEEVVWSLTGPFEGQHDPTVAPGGDLLVFDNYDVARGPESSRVIRLDATTGEVVWEFHATPQRPLFTSTGGSNAALPNGNVLITETRAGRALEVTPEGDVVWLFVNPGRVGPEGENMARLFELQRLPPDTPLDWLR